MKQNVLNTSIGLPTLLIEELKNVFKQKHPTQFIFDIAAKMKKDYPTYVYSNDDTLKYKGSCTFDNTIKGEGYNDQKKEAKSMYNNLINCRNCFRAGCI